MKVEIEKLTITYICPHCGKVETTSFDPDEIWTMCVQKEFGVTELVYVDVVCTSCEKSVEIRLK